ncbi:MAG: Fibronectin type domain protein, partial [Bacteroidetes bacterium]|nr:Fibronectin type domain protein [Bacteroidota bacterium]
MRSLLLLVSFLTFTVLQSQTLYWVGGSGNFNDPKHWSYVSGGSSANIVPGSNADVVLDNSVFNGTKINFQGDVHVNSLTIRTYAKVDLIGNAESRLIIRKSFTDIIDNKNFNSDIVLEFNNTTSSTGIIKTGNNLLNSDVVIRGGKWDISKIMTDYDKSLFIEGGSVNFSNAFIQTGNLKVQNTQKLEFDNTVLKVYNDLRFVNVKDYTVTKSYLKAKFVNGKIAADDKSGITGKFASSSIVMTPCIISPTVIKPSCVPGCDGQIIFTIPSPTSACYGVAPTPPFNVTINNAPGCNTVAGLSSVGPGTYTISGVCGCMTAYSILLFDQVGFIESESAPVTDPLVVGVTIGTQTINCPGACTGSVGTAFTGGTAPYTFTVFPPAPSASFTATSAGGLNVTNLCAGTLTINAQDSKGCTATYTRTILQPSPFSPAGVTTSVNCNGSCTGAAAVTPTGGTASYTVTWSTGASSVLTAGQSSSIGNLCASAAVISATVVDSKNCSYPATFTTVITGPPPLTVTATQTNVTCNGLSTGAASVAVSGSFPNYSYTWTPGGQTTNS